MDYEDEETIEEKYWEVITTDDVEEDLDRFVEYLLYQKKNEQAATAVLDDLFYFKDTVII